MTLFKPPPHCGQLWLLLGVIFSSVLNLSLLGGNESGTKPWVCPQLVSQAWGQPRFPPVGVFLRLLAQASLCVLLWVVLAHGTRGGDVFVGGIVGPLLGAAFWGTPVGFPISPIRGEEAAFRAFWRAPRNFEGPQSGLAEALQE